jgi:hypothetical protein
MERYFKTSRQSETGKKLKQIFDKAENFDKKVEELKEKYGFKGIVYNIFFYKGISAVLLDEEVDKTIWRKVKGVKDGYWIRERGAKAIKQDFDNWKELSIYRQDLDEIIGGGDPFCQAGFDMSNPDYYLFNIDEDWEYDVPEDCEEISNLEYKKLIKK